LGAGGTVAAVAELDTYELFEWDTAWYRLVDRFRSHAVATRAAVERIGGLVQLEDAAATATAALLHDLGKLVLTQLYARRTDLLADPRLTPDEALAAERSELGIDHPLAGAVLARRLALPEQTARAIERHHCDDAEGPAAAVRLADLIVHHSAGTAVGSSAVKRAGAALNLGHGKLARLFYGSPERLGEPAPLGSQPCPLSMRERDALRGLAEGKVYRQIAEDLQLSPSTVRSHLHHVYVKLGVHDRAQAVILARSRGWV
jgi:putative nucleotidyltransferase with HDIG domain